MATHHFLLHLILMLSVVINQAILGYACIEVEREALLTFKVGISDGTNHSLSSWDQSKDCCSWRGVVCDNNTGNVLELNLQNPYQLPIDDWDLFTWSSYALSGEISPSLLALNHLTRLDLSDNNFSDISIPEFIGSFKNLMHLNLSNSEFGGKIPHQLGNLSKLQSLDLSSSHFIRTIPPHLGNLSDLQYLGLNSVFYFNDNTKVDWLSHLTSLKYLGMSGLYLQSNVDWLQIINKLQSIKVLLMADSDLPNIPSSLPYVNFTHLTTLDLSSNTQFNTTLPSWLWNLTNLSNLNLRNCQFFGKIPDDIAKLTSLTYLNFGGNSYFGGNSFEGTLPRSFRKLCNLRGLDLSYLNIGGDIQELVGMLACNWNNMEEIILSGNNLQGNLSNWLEQMTNLKYLDLSQNSLGGSVPIGIGKLQNLKHLDLSFNSLHGVISEAHFASLTRLKVLHLSNNSLAILVDPNWIPPFQVTTVYLDFCQVGPHFPTWLRWQKQIRYLNLYNASIVDTMPDWLWSLPLATVDLSYNQITGMLPASLPDGLISLDLSHNNISGYLPASLPDGLNSLYLSNNNISGSLPASLPDGLNSLDLFNNKISGSLPATLPDGLNSLDLSNNNISGSLPASLPDGLDTLDLSNNYISGSLPELLPASIFSLFLSNNLINGSIPSSIYEKTQLGYLDLSRNSLSGALPRFRQDQLSTLMNLSSNNLTGEIPPSMGSLNYLQYLDLSNNNFYGELPSEMQYCKNLVLLDLRKNKFSGKIPTWIGERLSHLAFLQLRSNKFDGNIPSQLAELSSLQVLDLANNHLSGSIPRSFGNFSKLVYSTPNPGFYFEEVPFNADDITPYEIAMDLEIQGKESIYSAILYLVKTMDLSGNNLSGEIPEEIGALQQLRNLNFSGNNLIGRIPERIGDMLSLESLDFSSNELSGAIPQNLSKLTFLNHLNLSYNNLSGRIPSGSQLDRLDDPSIYIGNAYLCGPPTGKNCSGDQAAAYSSISNYANGSETIWLYIGVASGFVVGFWGVYIVLLFYKTWRYAYFKMIDNLFDKIYVTVAVTVNRLKNKYGR